MVDNDDGIAIVQESGIDYRLGASPLPWTEVYIKFKVAFRQRALRELKGSKLSVFICLALHMDSGGYAEPSIDTICEETGYEREAVCNAITDLGNLGLVEKHRRRRRTSRYQVKGYAWFGKGPSQPALFEEDSYSSEIELQDSYSSVTESSEIEPKDNTVVVVSPREIEQQQKDNFGVRKPNFKDELVVRLVDFKIPERVARSLLQEFGEERVSRQIQHYEWARRYGRANGAGWLIRAIQSDYELPDELLEQMHGEELVADPRRYTEGAYAEYIQH